MTKQSGYLFIFTDLMICLEIVDIVDTQNLQHEVDILFYFKKKLNFGVISRNLSLRVFL